MGGGFRTLGARGASERERFVSECDGLKTSRDASDKEPINEFVEGHGTRAFVLGILSHTLSSEGKGAAVGRCPVTFWFWSGASLERPQSRPPSRLRRSVVVSERRTFSPPSLTSPRSCSPCCRACSRWPGVGAAWPPRPPRATRAPFLRRRRSSRGGCSTLCRRRRAARRRRASP